MKKMKLRIWGTRKIISAGSDSKFELPVELEELSLEETKSIIAGESVSYWLGYVGGKIAQLFS
jgi:hypothetical protein